VTIDLPVELPDPDTIEEVRAVDEHPDLYLPISTQ
jgi:hypothetical protein